MGSKGLDHNQDEKLQLFKTVRYQRILELLIFFIFSSDIMSKKFAPLPEVNPLANVARGYLIISGKSLRVSNTLLAKA
jgi:hypothetical protein